MEYPYFFYLPYVNGIAALYGDQIAYLYIKAANWLAKVVMSWGPMNPHSHREALCVGVKTEPSQPPAALHQI